MNKYAEMCVLLCKMVWCEVRESELFAVGQGFGGKYVSFGAVLLNC